MEGGDVITSYEERGGVTPVPEGGGGATTPPPEEGGGVTTPSNGGAHKATEKTLGPQDEAITDQNPES